MLLNYVLDDVYVSLLLSLNIFQTFYSVFIFDFEKVMFVG